MYSEYLMHYGRKGMRWGQHLFGDDPKKKRTLAQEITRFNKNSKKVGKRARSMRVFEGRIDKPAAKFLLGKYRYYTLKEDIKKQNNLLRDVEPYENKKLSDLVSKIGVDRAEVSHRVEIGKNFFKRSQQFCHMDGNFY